VPLVGLLTGDADAHRPHLTADQRAQLIPAFEDDVKRFAKLIGQDFDDWLDTASRGSYLQRA
jgi:hypothetical protein